MNSNLDTVLSHLPDATQRGNHWLACCPAHDDKQASLSITEGDKGVLLKCFAGCETGAIVRAMGMTLSDLFYSSDRCNAVSRTKRIDATYDYVDHKGTLVYQAVRYVPKSFAMRRPDPMRPGQWLWGMKDVRNVLYRLPAVLKAVAETQRIYLVEGERDVDNLTQLGLCATTNIGGAGKWKSEYTGALRGAHVIVIPDNDAAGEKHLATVGAALRPVVASVKTLRLPNLPPKGDVSDWLASGGTVQELERLADAAPDFVEMAGTEKMASAPVGGVRLVTLADVEQEVVEWLWSGRIPFGAISIFEGNPGEGKSTLALTVASYLSTGRSLPGNNISIAPSDVLLLTPEDRAGVTIRPRLEAAGADLNRIHIPEFDEALSDGTLYKRPPTIPDDLPALRGIIQERGVRLIIVDPLSAVLSGSVDALKDQDVRRALVVLSTLAEEAQCAVLIVRHLTKGGGANAIFRGGGSMGIVGAARSALLVGKDPDNPERRILASVKNNLSKEAASLVFHLEDCGEVARVVWDGESSHSANDVLASFASADNGSMVDEAADFLSDVLSNGPVCVNSILTEAKNAAISETTLNRAKKKLGVVSAKEGMKGPWVWRLPDSAITPSPAPKVVSDTRRESPHTVDSLRKNVTAFDDTVSIPPRDEWIDDSDSNP